MTSQVQVDKWLDSAGNWEFRGARALLHLGASSTIKSSMNIASVTRTNTGSYTVTFIRNMPDNNYLVVTGMAVTNGAWQATPQLFCGPQSASLVAPTVSGFAFNVLTINASGYNDPNDVMFAVF